MNQTIDPLCVVIILPVSVFLRHRYRISESEGRQRSVWGTARIPAQCRVSCITSRSYPDDNG